MKKIIITILMFVLTSAGHAKSELDALSYWLMPGLFFASAEGSYNWIETDSFILNNQGIKQTEQNGGGRASGGLLYFATERFGMGIEAGWGYYGSVSMGSLASNGWHASKKIEGYDVLFDMLYEFDKVDLLGNVGFMIQKQNFHLNVDGESGLLRSALEAQLVNFYDESEILPEVKVGGMYHLSDHIGISLTYMYVFGSAYQNAEGDDESIDTGSGSGTAKNPSLSTLMLGVRYSFEP